MFMNLKRIGSTVLLALYLGSASAQIGPAGDADVPYIATQLASANPEEVKEALVILRWSGINDPRIFDPFAAKLESGELPMKQALVYVEALGLSGNPKYESVLDSIAADKKRPGGLRNAATRAKETLGRYKSVAEEMNKGVEQAKTNSELWAIRHRNGLAVQDSVRMRWAARDVYLHKRGPESLDVAAEVLRAESTVQTQDRIRVDGFAFLCKALGLAGDRKYTETLKHLANNATNDKLADYAERSAQYYDPQFKRVRSVHKPKKKGTPR